ncbi:MAG TPA: ATP-binding protein, partial [Chloroflexota bacterium]|nr:ATP-binding protein [Chloroflexota bacterium]
PIALAIIGHDLLSRRPMLASAAVVGGLLALVTIAVWLQPGSLLATFYGLVVLIAGATGGALAGFLTAGLAVILLTLAYLAVPARVDLPLLLASATIAVAGAVLSRVATGPIHVALEWAWQSYDESRRVTEELRDRQIALGRALKSLNEAYLQLEHLNDELTRARQAAEEARRLKAQFAANISHELRTPLNLIIGFAEMMATVPQAYGDHPLPELYRRDLEAILRNARHLAGLIDDVLELSQIEAGRMGLVKESVRLSEVVAEAVGAAARLIAGRGLRLEVYVPDDLPMVYVDRTRIRQVLINLLNNAARFTDTGGVTITARVDGGDVRVSVADTGIGIAPEDLPKVFEEFRQLDGSLRRRAGGTGLGLAICKQFIELHGGAIWAESAVGVGTTFHFTLPIGTNVAAGVLPGDWKIWDRIVSARQPTPPEVRVVSADPSAARIIQRYLEGYQIREFTAFDEAVQAEPTVIGARQAYVVVSSSPEEMWAAMTSSQRVPDGAPLLGCVLPSRRAGGPEPGVAAYLIKPVTREQVLSALDRLGVRLRSVLIVDDELDMLRLLGHWVRSARRRCQALLANGGEEALAILRAKRPDAVILDMLMPGIDGAAVLAAMRGDARLRDVPVIVITSRERPGDEVTAGLLGATRAGGFSITDLTRCLRAALDVLISPSPGAPVPGEARSG